MQGQGLLDAVLYMDPDRKSPEYGRHIILSRVSLPVTPPNGPKHIAYVT